MSLHNTQTRSVEWLLSGLMVAWGLVLLLPGNSMDLHQFRYLGAIAAEEVWAAFSVSIGALRLFALHLNGGHDQSPLVRAAGAAFGVIWWLVLGFLLMQGAQGAPTPPSIAWYPLFVCAEGYSVWRSARDAFHSGALRKWQTRTAP